MEIVHEPPRRDLSFFARAPLRLRVADGTDVVIQEWSVAGVRKPEGIEIFPTRGTLSIPFQGIDIGFPVNLSADATGEFFAFQDLTVRQREALSLFHTNLLSGRMAATEDVITALDTPVDLVPMGETAEEKAEGTANTPPRIWRVVKAMATYIAAAVLIFGLLGQSVATRVLSIPTVQARVIAPEMAHLSTAAAYVDRVLVDEGEAVKQGDTLIRMSDPRREGRLDDARRAAKKHQDALTEARAVLRKHEATYASVLADLELQLEQALELQDETLADDVAAFIEMTNAAILALEEGRSLRDGDYHDMRRDLIAIRDARKEDLRQAKRSLGIAKADARLLDVKAQFDGVVRLVPALEDTHVSRGTELVVVEENAPRTVRAWVDEAHLTRLTPGLAARMRMPSPEGPVAVEGTVAHVVAGIDESAAKRGFGLIVTISVAEDATLQPGAPVDLRVWRSWVPEWAR